MASTKNLIYYIGIVIVVANNLSQTIDAITTLKASFIISFLLAIAGIMLDEQETRKLR